MEPLYSRSLGYHFPPDHPTHPLAPLDFSVVLKHRCCSENPISHENLGHPKVVKGVMDVITDTDELVWKYYVLKGPWNEVNMPIEIYLNTVWECVKKTFPIWSYSQLSRVSRVFLKTLFGKSVMKQCPEQDDWYLLFRQLTLYHSRNTEAQQYIDHYFVNWKPYFVSRLNFHGDTKTLINEIEHCPVPLDKKVVLTAFSNLCKRHNGTDQDYRIFEATVSPYDKQPTLSLNKAVARLLEKIVKRYDDKQEKVKEEQQKREEERIEKEWEDIKRRRLK